MKRMILSILIFFLLITNASAASSSISWVYAEDGDIHSRVYTNVDCNLIAALYDGNTGKQKEIQIKDINKSRDSQSITIGLANNVLETDTIKLFLVDKDTYSPLCEEKTIDCNNHKTGIEDINTKDDLLNYVNNKMRVIETPLGELEVETSIIENTYNSFPFDWIIGTDYSQLVSLCYDMQHSMLYSEDDIRETLDILRDYQIEIYHICKSCFPEKKVVGGFNHSYYKWPNIREGYTSIDLFSWSNYHITNYTAPSYELDYYDYEITYFHWTPDKDDYHFINSSVENQIQTTINKFDLGEKESASLSLICHALDHFNYPWLVQLEGGHLSEDSNFLWATISFLPTESETKTSYYTISKYKDGDYWVTEDSYQKISSDNSLDVHAINSAIEFYWNSYHISS